MITSWQELDQWIRDNNLSRWIFTKNNRDKAVEAGTDSNARNDKIVDSDYYGENLEDKLAITKRNLEQYGRIVYGYGWQQNGKRTDGIYCEVLLNPAASQQVSGIGNTYTQQDIAGMEKRIREQIKAEMAAEKYERERKDFEKEKKQFEQDKAGVMGLLVQHLAPIARQVIGTNGLGTTSRRCAGLDAPDNVTTPRIEPQAPVAGENEEPEIENPFTEDEEDKAFRLLARFKVAEPENWLKMIEKVVTMAESGDAAYTYAKGFLVG